MTLTEWLAETEKVCAEATSANEWLRYAYEADSAYAFRILARTALPKALEVIAAQQRVIEAQKRFYGSEGLSRAREAEWNEAEAVLKALEESL